MSNVSFLKRTDEDKRVEHLNTLASIIFGLTLELKELIDVHEELLNIYEMENRNNEHLKQLNQQLITLKKKFTSIENENKKTDTKLKKYKVQNTSVHLQIKKTSENIKKIKTNIIREERKKAKIRKESGEQKFICRRALKTKQSVDKALLQLMKKKNKVSNKVIK